jgi:NTE family protein
MIFSFIKGLFSTNEQKIKNYIFQGGSIKGISYIGALEVLENDGIKLANIKRIGGTSVGAITAALLSVGCDLKELNKELSSLNFEEFIDIPDDLIKKQSLEFFSDFRKKIEEAKNELSNLTDGFKRIKKRELLKYSNDYYTGGNLCSKRKYIDQAAEFVKLIEHALAKKGLADGNKILEWIEEKIRVKTKITHATFGELYELHRTDPKKYKQLYLMGTNLNTKKPEIFSHEHTPNVIISDAVRISMSIPVVFRPHHWYEKKGNERQLVKNDLYVDGGLLHNYPIWLFDNKKYFNKYEKNRFNSETLGFRLEPLQNILLFETLKGGSETDNNEKSMEMTKYELVTSPIMCFYEKQDSDFNLQIEDHKDRTILIEDRGISTLKFNLNQEEKLALIHSGKLHAQRYLYLKEAQNNLKNEDNYTSIIIRLAIVGVAWGILSLFKQPSL